MVPPHWIRFRASLLSAERHHLCDNEHECASRSMRLRVTKIRSDANLLPPQVTLNVVIEVIAGYLLPGRPLANMVRLDVQSDSRRAHERPRADLFRSNQLFKLYTVQVPGLGLYYAQVRTEKLRTKPSCLADNRSRRT